MVRWNEKIHEMTGSFSLLIITWSSGQDEVVRLYLKIPWNFMLLILTEGFRFVH